MGRIDQQKILVVADFPFYRDKVHGGFQRRLHPMLESLADKYQLSLCCGETTDLKMPRIKIFPMYDQKCALKTEYKNLLAQLSNQTDLLISLETEWKLAGPKRKILLLGGLAYAWSWNVIRSSQWERVIVPSQDTQKKLKQSKIRSTTIPNGYDWSTFPRLEKLLNLRTLRPKMKILTSPHRPDATKGHKEAILLTHKLLKNGLDCVLKVPHQNFFMTPPAFYQDLQQFAARYLPRKNFITHPWIPQKQMAEYYADSDLTLAFGSAEEGFGAVVVESIVCGTPVLASRRGAIPSLVPPNHGLFLVDQQYQVKEGYEVAAQVLTSPAQSLDDIITRGRSYIESHYSQEKMIDKYLKVIQATLTT